MSTSQIRKFSLLDAHRNQSTPSNILNSADITLNSTNLESYKKALHSIVRKLNKTPSSSSKASLKRSDSKLNHTQQAMQNQSSVANHNASSSNLSKKYYISASSNNKNQSSIANRSQSNERFSYKANKELLNRSMQEPYLRKDSFCTSITKSVSANKPDNPEYDDLMEEKLAKGDFVYAHDTGLSSALLNDASLTHLDPESDKKIRDLVNKYQIRDAVHRQEISKLKKSNDMLRTRVFELEKEVDKNNKSKDLEKRYISKLEDDLNQLKETIRLEAVEKKSHSLTVAENKENQYLKIIEELRAQVSNLTSEKKLMEHLLKNALLRAESAKENPKEDKKSFNTPSTSSLDTSSLVINSCKYASGKEKIKTNTTSTTSTNIYTKKTIGAESYNDENDYSSHALYQLSNKALASMSVKLDKDVGGLKEVKLQNLVGNFGKTRTNDLTSTNDGIECCSEEGDEPFPNKVFHPRLNEKSLKERMDMNLFKLDLTRISKNRKVD